MSEAIHTSRREDGGGASNEAVELFKTILYALLIALVLRVLLFQPFTIPSASMEPNLFEGDYIVVTKFSYGYSRQSIPLGLPLFKGRVLGRDPHRGDIVVFKTPVDNRTDLIKRVIGLPGDRIQMRRGLLYLNGVQVPRTRLPDVAEDAIRDGRPVERYRETLPGGTSYVTQDWGPAEPLDDTPVLVVPEGHYFMMGDNRDNSMDSRVDPTAGGVGYLPSENVVGHARIVLMAWNHGAALIKPWTWFDLNTQRFLHELK